MKEKITSIRITKKTKEQLKKFGEFGETYEDVIKKLIKNAGRKENEKSL